MGISVNEVDGKNATVLADKTDATSPRQDGYCENPVADPELPESRICRVIEMQCGNFSEISRSM